MLYTRNPECYLCPLNGQRIVWGDGPLDAEILFVAEAPGPEEEKQGVPLIGPTGKIVASILSATGLRRDQVRLENTIQCRASATSAKGARAVEACGPSVHDTVAAMPNLRLIVTFGEPALQEVTRFRETHQAWGAYTKARRAYERRCETLENRYRRALEKYQERRRAWSAKAAAATAAGRKVPKEPKRPDRPEMPEKPDRPNQPVGYSKVSLMRGSPLTYPDGRGILVMPTLHPAATMPFRSPRLRPLLGLDVRKGLRLMHTGPLPEPRYVTVNDPDTLAAWFRDTPPGPIALDLEWSREVGDLACIGIGGPDGRYALVVHRTNTGYQAHPTRWARTAAVLQREFDRPDRAWGGHYACGYDERKLAEKGLRLHCSWDSLYGFHLTSVELGSSRDDLGDDLPVSQASGYDLGFVSSVLTDRPYHKGVVTKTRDAFLASSRELWDYCIGDVARTYEAWQVMRPSFEADPKLAKLLTLEMEVSRRAAAMTLTGIPVREIERQTVLRDLAVDIEAIRWKIGQVVGRPDFNPNSGPQLAAALEEAAGVRIRRNRTTGNAQLDAKQMAALQERHPDNELIGLVLELRQVEKTRSMVEGLEPDQLGRAHPQWKVHGTTSGRWSSSPNFQNLTPAQRRLVG